MRRRLFALGALFGLICGSMFPAAAVSTEASGAFNTATFAPTGPQEGHTIRITPVGPSQADVDAAKTRALNQPATKQLLKGTEHRIISFELTGGQKTGEDTQLGDSFRTTIFDYTNNRAFVCRGRLDSADVQVTKLLEQPDPNGEEFDAAVEIVVRDKDLGPAIRARQLQPYRPMPPLVNAQAPVGKVNRTIAVGLMPKGTKYQNQIVGVDLIKKTLVRFPSNAPPAALATPVVCGLPGSGGSNGRGLTGQAEIVVSRDGVEIWKFTVIRPSSSSGTKGSAIELLNVNFRGKRVLTQAHVPILNVKYDGNACGPYRDWQYQEGEFIANGTDVAPGVRMCTSAPQTILESGADAGNFRGVAIYDNREDVVVVSELNAGWYRYISRWTFTDGGTIKPRFGFGSVDNSCVCNIHMHHVYWRFDFDLATAANNSATDNFPGRNQEVQVESMLPRTDRLNQTLTVSNEVSGESVVLRPGPWDSNYDKYGKGDVWVLRHSANEIDDHVTCTTCTASFINLAQFINNPPESTDNTDIVVWYGAHFNHINGNVACGTSAGPDIEITRW